MSQPQLLSQRRVTSVAITEKLSEYLESLSDLSISFFTKHFSGRTTMPTTDTNTSNVNRNFKKNKSFFIPLAAIIFLVLLGMFWLLRGSSTPTQAITTGDERVELKKADAEQVLNKSFSFPIKDSSGKEVSKLKYTIEKAELRDEIIVKGQRATSVKGRTFLVLPIKITNDFNQAVEIDARDYIRLIVNNSPEKLAADIHNDPVEVQAISTKQTRLGFPIDDDEKNIVLQIGEINGKKENIRLTLTK